MEFVNPNSVKQPAGGLILEERKETDYLLGANDPKNLGVAINDGHWAKYAEQLPIEIQRVIDGDTYCCTAFSDNNIDEMLYLAQYGEQIDISDMFVGVGSGNRRGVGNTMKAPAEFKRKSGFALEAEYPYSRTMTLDQFYSPIPQRVYALAEPRNNKGNLFESGYLDVGDTSDKGMLEALKVSPIKIAIEGNYVFDGSGRLMNTGSAINHAVVWFDYVLADSTKGPINGNILEKWIYCSETAQFLKMRGDYRVVAPMVKTFKKKAPRLVKWAASPAVFAEFWDGSLASIDDSKEKNKNGTPLLTGGDLVKLLAGNYSNAKIFKYNPIANPNDPRFDPSKVKGSIKLTLN